MSKIKTLIQNREEIYPRSVANAIGYDNTISGLNSTDVKDAIDELIYGIDDEPIELPPIEGNTGSNQAIDIKYNNSNSKLDSNNVQDAITELSLEYITSKDGVPAELPELSPDSSIQAHNESPTAHQDIRQLIEELQNNSGGDTGDSNQAEDISYNNSISELNATNVQQAIDELKNTTDELFTSVSNGKQLIASAITDKGIQTENDATFQEMATNIGQIQGGEGIDTSDATATENDIRKNKTAYVDGQKITGTLGTVSRAEPDITVSQGGLITSTVNQQFGVVSEGVETATKQLDTQNSQIIYPTTEDIVILQGKYLTGNQTIVGDSKLTTDNIRSGITLFNVTGTYTSDATALASDITVGKTAYVNGVKLTGTKPISNTGLKNLITVLVAEDGVNITITNEDRTLTGVSSNGQVSFEIDKPGRWTVSGSGNGSWETTYIDIPEIVSNNKIEILLRGSLIKYEEEIERVSDVGECLVLSNGNKLFVKPPSNSEVDIYSLLLVKENSVNISNSYGGVMGAYFNNKIVYCGGIKVGTPSYYYKHVRTIDQNLTMDNSLALTEGGSALSVCAVEDYIIIYSGTSKETTEVFDKLWTNRTIEVLEDTYYHGTCGKLGNYAIFQEGATSSTEDSYLLTVYAYDNLLVKTQLENLINYHYDGATASIGHYILFAGGDSTGADVTSSIDIYNDTLTKVTSTINLSIPRKKLCGQNLGNYVLFAGGQGDSTSNIYDTVDVFDGNLTKVNVNLPLNGGKRPTWIGSDTIGNYAIIAGGYGYENNTDTSKGNVDTLEAYTIV